MRELSHTPAESDQIERLSVKKRGKPLEPGQFGPGFVHPPRQARSPRPLTE